MILKCKWLVGFSCVMNKFRLYRYCHLLYQITEKHVTKYIMYVYTKLTASKNCLSSTVLLQWRRKQHNNGLSFNHPFFWNIWKFKISAAILVLTTDKGGGMGGVVSEIERISILWWNNRILLNCSYFTVTSKFICN